MSFHPSAFLSSFGKVLPCKTPTLLSSFERGLYRILGITDEHQMVHTGHKGAMAALFNLATRHLQTAAFDLESHEKVYLV